MKIILVIIGVLFAGNIMARSFVTGVVYIQDRWDQSVSTMQFFPLATISAAGSNETVSNSVNGRFTLEFPGLDKGAEIYIRVPEEGLMYHNAGYEVVNTGSLTAITGTGKSVVIMVCKKGLRAQFEQQLATHFFQQQLKKANSDPIIKELVFKTTAVVLSNLFTQNEKENIQLRRKVNEGNYFDTKALLQPIMQRAFKYIEQEKTSGLHYENLYQSSRSSIEAYIYACILCYRNKEGIQLYRRLYELKPDDIRVIEGYANYLRYLEYYDEARTIYQQGQVARITPDEKGSINFDLVRLYLVLDRLDTARSIAQATLEELDRLPYKSLKTLHQMCFLYYAIALSLEFDDCIPFYQKALAGSRQMLQYMSMPNRKKEVVPKEMDSAFVYYSMCTYYSDLGQKDSVKWALKMSQDYMSPLNLTGTYTENLAGIGRQLQQLQESSDGDERSLDSLLLRKADKGNSYETALIFNQKAMFYIYRNKTDSARALLMQELAIFDTIERKDLAFRKLRLRKSEALKTLAACLYREGPHKIDSAIYYYQQALAVLSDNTHLIRESYSKEITEAGKEMLEWMNIARAGQQGLMRIDSGLLKNKATLDTILAEADRIYKKNPLKYAPVICASFLYGASVYATNNTTTTQAKDYARKALGIARDQNWLLRDSLTQQGYSALLDYLVYPDVTLGMLGNMYWLSDSLTQAIDYYTNAADLEKKHPELLYFLPLSRLYYELGASQQASEFAAEGYFRVKKLNKPYYHALENQFLLMKTSIAMQLGKYDDAFSYATYLLTNDTTNYAYTEEVTFIILFTANKMGQFSNTIVWLKKSNTAQLFDAEPKCAVEAAWASFYSRQPDTARLLLDRIPPEELKEMQPFEQVRYYALMNVISTSRQDESFAKKEKEWLSYSMNEDKAQYYVISAALFTFTDNISKAEVYLALAEQEEKNIEDEIPQKVCTAMRLDQQGRLWWSQGKNTLAKQALSKALGLYDEQKGAFIYERSQLKKLLTEIP